MANLSKSRFLSGNQCEKKLYFDVYRKELRPAVSPQQQALFDTGHRVGELARQLFPGGLDATEDMNSNWSVAIERTKSWLNEGKTTIYEATFSLPGLFAALDILHHKNEERWAIEVKSSTEVKDYHITDAAFQYFVMKEAGHAPDRVFLMHINNSYVRNGDINPAELFHLEDITEQVLSSQPYVSNKHAELLEMLNRRVEPQIGIGKHCSNPFNCDYMGHCWAHLPKNHVFNLYSAHGKDYDLYEQGILDLVDVPDDFPLNHRQQLQIKGVKYNEKYIDTYEIRAFLQPIEGPLYFFDFETIFAALPVMDGTRPFEQVPFQYSLHISDRKGNNLQHREFLADPEDFSNPNRPNPLYQLLQQLKEDIGETGSIVSYNASFEATILKSLARKFPEEQAFIDNLLSRFVDLLIPFRKGWYYTPEMGASASIKYVLPAFDLNFSYDDLEIQNGGVASDTFLTMVQNTFSGDRDAIKTNLLKYCERDTLGMVIIYRALIAI